jgi:PST family polysaccharide transporter
MFELVKTKVSEYSKRYQIDLAYVIKNEFWVYLRLGTSLITGLAVSVVFARLSPREVYGQYNFVLAILAIASILSIPGLKSAVLRSTARGNEGNYKMAVKTSFLWSLLGIPALLGVGAYYYYYNAQIIGICLMMSSIFFPFVFAPNTWNSFLAGKKRFDLTARYGMAQSSISAAAIIGILFLNANHLVLIFAIHLIITSLLACLLYWRSLKYIENKVKDDEVIRYGYFLTTTNITGILAQHVDKILIGILLGAPQLAIYTIAIVIPTNIKDMIKIFWSPFHPKISEQGTSIGEVRSKIKRLVLPLALAVLGGSLLYWLFIDDIMLLFFSTKYIESTKYSKILLLMILVSIPTSFLGTFTIAKKDTKAIVLGLHVSQLLRFVITCSFIYLWGIMGAVWALNLGVIIQVLLYGVGMRGEEMPLDQQFEGTQE